MLEAPIHTADHGVLGYHVEGTGVLCPRVTFGLFSGGFFWLFCLDSVDYQLCLGEVLR